MENLIKRTVVLALTICASNAAWPQASRLTIGTATVQTIVEKALFTRQGRWYLADNDPCYAYLEYPKVHLEGGRVYLDAHLSSQLGAVAFGKCLGPGLASNLTLSGRAVWEGSRVTLDDIRIDHVEDSNTAAAISLLQQAAPQTLPHAVSIDVLAAAHGNPVNAAGISISVAKFQIVSISTSLAGLVVDFTLALTAP